MRPDTPADHTTEAERLLRTAAQYPEDHEPLILQAAAHLNSTALRPRSPLARAGTYRTALSRPFPVAVLPR
ncbi:hypothetical protein [Streptomyces sp. WY228]|uniref:hypothetical protein n=1 Tax=Streptomyces sp. WY228 TaxID=2855836 RepID=UPI00211AB8E6|nr:hypothetical protein [Streptomyces sp. WY228]